MSARPSSRSSGSGLRSSSSGGRRCAALFSLNAPLFLSPADNELVGALVIASLVAARGLAPRSHRMASAGGLAFTAAMRMVDRVHGHAAVDRFLAQPYIAARFADGHVLMVHIANL